MITTVPAATRGTTSLKWLTSHHSFSFGGYSDPSRMGHGALRVINDDIIAPGGGFDMHPHRDMEIVTYILDGELAHRDSMGHHSILRAGDLQRMTAGRGVFHSEFNASASAPLHLLQIWVIPSQRGLTPSYEERSARELERSDSPLTLLASPTPQGGAVKIHQAIELFLLRLDPHREIALEMGAEGRGWIHVIEGSLTYDRETLSGGDALKIDETHTPIKLSAGDGTTPLRALFFRS